MIMDRLAQIDRGRALRYLNLCWSALGFCCGGDSNCGATGEGGSVLGFAAKTGNLKLVKVLLAYDASVDVPSTRSDGLTNGRSALAFAAENGHAEIAQLLIEKGAAVDSSSTGLDHSNEGGGDAALYIALENCYRNDQVGMVQLLLDYGADVNLQIKKEIGPSNTI